MSSAAALLTTGVALRVTVESSPTTVEAVKVSVTKTGLVRVTAEDRVAACNRLQEMSCVLISKPASSDCKQEFEVPKIPASEKVLASTVSPEYMNLASRIVSWNGRNTREFPLPDHTEPCTKPLRMPILAIINLEGDKRNP
jgi:hypothetical protein